MDPAQQRAEALAKANRHRQAKAQLKRDLKAGRVSFREVIIEPPDYLQTAKVHDLLVHLPRFGRVKAATALQRARIWPGTTFGQLSQSGRYSLLTHLEYRYPQSLA